MWWFKRIGARLGRIAICLIALIGGAVGGGTGLLAEFLVSAMFRQIIGIGIAFLVLPWIGALVGFFGVFAAANKLDLVPAPEETNLTRLRLE